MAEFPSSSPSAAANTTHLNGANEDEITEEPDLELGHVGGDENVEVGAEEQPAGGGNEEGGAGVGQGQQAAQPVGGGNVEVGAGQQPQVGAGQGGQQAAPIFSMTPLYLAIFLGNSDAAQMISGAQTNDMKNCGPYGQNLLHIAVLRSKDLTREVLARDDLTEDDIDKVDNHGNTPLHYAASVGVKDVTGLIVARYPNMKKTRDRNNMCPIHIAASVGAMDAIFALVSGDNPSADLRDGKGGTFLHVAVKNRQTNVVKFVSRDNRFRDILNIKDNDGNTALHLAVQNRDESNFSHLLGNRNVQLNLVNKIGYTPLDLACKIKIQNSFASLQNPTEWMIRVLAHSGAQFSARRRDWKFGTPENAQEHQSQAKHAGLAASTESVLVASALIATVTFAAAFTVPGSYKTDGSPRGTPVLGRNYGFKVFLVADLLAFFCSVVATFSLAAYGTQWNVDPLVRCIYAQRAVRFFHIALKSVIVAFALGFSVVMWDISVSTTVIVGAATLALVLYGNEALAHDLRLMRVMWQRFGLSRSWNLQRSTSFHLDWNTWWLRSFTATVVWNVIDLSWTYICIYFFAYLAQLKQKADH